MLSADKYVAAEMDRVAAALRTAIRLSGVTQRQIERELLLHTGYLQRILSGQVQLRMGHILGICRAIGLPAGNFFSSLFPPTPPRTVAEARLARGLGSLFPAPEQAADPEALLQELQGFLERVAAVLESEHEP